MGEEIYYITSNFISHLYQYCIGDIKLIHFVTNTIKNRRITSGAYWLLCQMCIGSKEDLLPGKLSNKTFESRRILKEIKKEEITIEKIYKSMGGKLFFTSSVRNRHSSIIKRDETFVIQMISELGTDPLLLSIYLNNADFAAKYMDNIRSNRMLCYQIIRSLCCEYKSSGNSTYKYKSGINRIFTTILSNILLRWFLLSQVLVCDILHNKVFKELL